jgi:hypothetical protein
MVNTAPGSSERCDAGVDRSIATASPHTWPTVAAFAMCVQWGTPLRVRTRTGSPHVSQM